MVKFFPFPNKINPQGQRSPTENIKRTLCYNGKGTLGTNPRDKYTNLTTEYFLVSGSKRNVADVKTQETSQTPHGLSQGSDQLCSPEPISDSPVLPPEKVLPSKNVLTLPQKTIFLEKN